MLYGDSYINYYRALSAEGCIMDYTLMSISLYVLCSDGDIDRDICQDTGVSFRYERWGKTVRIRLRQNETWDIIQMLETWDIARHRQQDMRWAKILRI